MAHGQLMGGWLEEASGSGIPIDRQLLSDVRLWGVFLPFL